MAVSLLTSLLGRRAGFDRLGRFLVQGRSLILGYDGDYPIYADGLIYANTAASTAITNTATETAFSLVPSIPANSLHAGSVIRVRYQGIATATNGTDTLTIKLYLGTTSGTALIAEAATDVANNDVFTGEYELIVRTIGASGTVVGVGTYKSIPAAEGTMTVKDDILASTTLDTTAAVTFTASAKWSAASASNSCRLDIMRVFVA